MPLPQPLNYGTFVGDPSADNIFYLFQGIDTNLQYLDNIPLNSDQMTAVQGAVTAAVTALGLGALAYKGTINNVDWSGTPLAVANGGSGAATALQARVNLGLNIGTNVQAWDADLDALAALTTTAYGRSLLTQASAAATVSALGLTADNQTMAYRTPIPDSSDLNTYTSTGLYPAMTSAGASGTNFPAGVGGVLEVKNSATNTVVWQTYHTANGIWQRRYSGTTWNAWAKMYDSLNFVAGTDYLTPASQKRSVVANGASTQTITVNSAQKVTFTTVNLALPSGSEYDATNSRFTPAAGDRWRIVGRALATTGFVSGEVGYIGIYKNGTTFLEMPYTHAGATQPMEFTPCEFIVEGNGTDYYEIWAFVTGAASKVLSTGRTFTMHRL